MDLIDRKKLLEEITKWIISDAPNAEYHAYVALNTVINMIREQPVAERDDEK